MQIPQHSAAAAVLMGALMIQDSVHIQRVSKEQERSWDIPGTLAGFAPIRNADSPPTVKRNSACILWPHTWRQDDCLIAIDGYLVWPDRLMLGGSPADQRQVSEALLRNPVSWLREIKNGCFNLVVHDFARKRTLLASDRFGFLPLYIFSGKDGWWFASDLESLRSIAPSSLELDETGLAELYWFGYQIGDRTVYRNVRMMPAGTIVSLSWLDGSLKEESWSGTAEPYPEADCVGLEEAPARYVELMRKACDRLYHPSLRYGITLSGGMDSRMIAACWQRKPMRSYTWGDPDSTEMKIASRLAARLGFPHTEIPVQGDFFRLIHPPMFQKYGLMEFISGLGNAYMRRDGTQVVLEGTMGDVLFSAIFMKRRKTWADNLRYTLGMRYVPQQAPMSSDAVAESIFDNIRVPDAYFSVVCADRKQEMDHRRDQVLNDLSGEVRRFRCESDSLQRIIEKVKINNRTRRYISLMSAQNRPLIQTCFPFIDSDLEDFARRVLPVNKANAKLYIRVYSSQLRRVRDIPPAMSLLPFWVPVGAHYYGRIYKHLREVIAERVLHRSRGRIRLCAMDAFQWSRWLASNATFREGIAEYLADSTAVDSQAFSQFMQSMAGYRKQVTGTRLMLTLSYCAWYKPQYQRDRHRRIGRGNEE